MTLNSRQTALEYLAGTDADDEQVEVDEPACEDTTLLAPHRTLGLHLLEAVMTTAQLRRFRDAPTLCVVIEAPTPAWVGPLRSAAMALAKWHHVEIRDGTARYARKTTEGEEPLALTLSAGLRLLAVSHAPERHLPPSLIAGADMRIRTGNPTPEVIRRTIRDATGTKPRAASERLGGRLDYFDLVSAIRLGSDARSCLRRLASATANRTVVDRFPAGAPDLASLHGYGEAGEWAKRLVEDVDSWRRGDIVDFSTIDRQVVFAGPPGTGKSTLVSSISKSTNLPLISTSVARWFIDGNGNLDGVLKQAEAVFTRATDASPAILFLDEIDAIPCRAKVTPRNADFWAPIVGYILAFLDGVSSAGPSSAGLIVIGATNFADALDPALVRPGRLSRVIEIPPPDEEDIPGILRQHLGHDLPGTCLDDVASLAAGSTGAMLAAWVRGARRRARVARRAMMIGDLMAEVSAPDNRSPASLWRCAVHEASHAIAVVVAGSSSIRSISIQAAAGRGGRVETAYPPGEVTRSRADLEADIVAALAGRAGEVAFGLGASTGAHEDLAIATELAASIHGSFGMGDGLAQRRPMGHAASLMAEPAFRRVVETTLAECAARATEIVTAHRGLVETVAHALVERGRLDATRFGRLVEAYRHRTGPCGTLVAGGCHHG